MLINLSNHPSEKWSPLQTEAAKVYGKIIDLPFPAVDPLADSAKIDQFAQSYFLQIVSILATESKGPDAVHLMGELTFCFSLVLKLKTSGIQCLASTAKRETCELPDGAKKSKFVFARFREYFS